MKVIYVCKAIWICSVKWLDDYYLDLELHATLAQVKSYSLLETHYFMEDSFIPGFMKGIHVNSPNIRQQRWNELDLVHIWWVPDRTEIRLIESPSSVLLSSYSLSRWRGSIHIAIAAMAQICIRETRRGRQDL